MTNSIRSTGTLYPHSSIISSLAISTTGFDLSQIPAHNSSVIAKLTGNFSNRTSGDVVAYSGSADIIA